MCIPAGQSAFVAAAQRDAAQPLQGVRSHQPCAPLLASKQQLSPSSPSLNASKQACPGRWFGHHAGEESVTCGQSLLTFNSAQKHTLMRQCHGDLASCLPDKIALKTDQ